jgi:hypothetical protein
LLHRAHADIAKAYVNVFGNGSDHFLSLSSSLDDASIAFNKVTAAFQCRPLSNVVMSMEHVITSGEMASVYQRQMEIATQVER